MIEIDDRAVESVEQDQTARTEVDRSVVICNVI